MEVKMNKEKYDEIEKYLDTLGYERFYKHKEILDLIKKRNGYSDLDMEIYHAIAKCEAMNKTEVGYLKGCDCYLCNNRGHINTYIVRGGKVYYPVAEECKCMVIRRANNFKNPGEE